MSNRIMKKMSLAVITAAIGASLSVTAFAANEPGRKAYIKSEFGGFNQTLGENSDALRKVAGDNVKLSKQITVLQRKLKESGAITNENTEALSEMSIKIKEKRAEINTLRNKVKELREEVRENIKADNADQAKASLEEAKSVQAEQLTIHNELNEALNAKLNYLNSFSNDDINEQVELEIEIESTDEAEKLAGEVTEQ